MFRHTLLTFSPLKWLGRLRFFLLLLAGQDNWRGEGESSERSKMSTTLLPISTMWWKLSYW